MSKKHNKKLPKDAVSEQEIDPAYGHIFGHWDECGGHHFTYRNFEEASKVFDQTFNPDGSYSTSESNSEVKQIRSDFHVGEHRKYVGGGGSQHSDSHFDMNSEGTFRMEAAADLAMATAMKYLQGVGTEKIEIAGNQAKVGTGSLAGGMEGYKDGKAITTDGLFSVRSKKKIVLAAEEDMIHMVGSDFASYTKGGFEFYAEKDSKTETEKNYFVETGQKFSTNSTGDTIMNSAAKFTANSKQEMKLTSKADITIESDTTITLKVGQNSIEISSSGITINAGGGKLDLKASGDVTTQGSTTKLQGGGSPGTPTTIT